MANSFAEAFEKSGIVAKGTVTDLERQKKKREAEEKKKIEDEQKKVKEAALRDSDEFTKKIKPFDDLWNNEKSQGFIKHIINAFSPFHKAQYVWDFSEGQEHKCFICGTPLISKIETMNEFLSHDKEIIENFKKELRGEIESSSFENAKLVLDGKVLAVGSEESKKCFCHECAQNFSEWVINKMFTDQKFGNYMTFIRKKEMGLLKNKSTNS